MLNLFYYIYMKKYDTILVLQQDINEDRRTNSTRTAVGSDSGPGIYVGAPDPRMYSAYNFGRTLQNMLNNIGNGFYSQVSDFGKYVSVTIGYNNPVTGRSATKSFLIDFEGKGGDGRIFASSTRWRSISGADQAASYIRSSCSSLQSNTNN